MPPVARSAAALPPTSTRAPTPSMCARGGIVAGVSLARASASPRRRAPRGVPSAARAMPSFLARPDVDARRPPFIMTPFGLFGNSMLRRLSEFWRGRTRPVGAENSRCHACHILRKRRRAAPATPPRGSSPAVSLDPAARSARGAMVASALALARGPRLGSPRPGARLDEPPPRDVSREKKSREKDGRGRRRLGARDCALGGAVPPGRLRARRGRADAIALEILTRNGVGVLEVRRERAANASARADPRTSRRQKLPKKIFVGPFLWDSKIETNLRRT